MAKSYVKFEVPNEVVAKTYEALQLAKQSGAVKEGANEVTKSIERGLASFVVVAGDVDPEEVVMHIPMLCEQKGVAYSFVPSKLELGKSIGMTVPCTAIAVENQGNASSAIREVISKVSGVAPRPQAAPKEAKEEKKEAKQEKPKK